MIMEQKLCATCVALAVLVFAMAVPQGSALARGARGGGMDVRTADLCLDDTLLVSESPYGIGTVAAVTDKRSGITAWAVSLEGMLHSTVYYVYDTGQIPGGPDCVGDESKETFRVYQIPTNEYGEAYQNTVSDNGTNIPKVGDVVQICRYDGGLIPILEGVLVKGGKERNKPNRC